MSRIYTRYRKISIPALLPYIGKTHSFYSFVTKRKYNVRLGSERMKLLGRTQECNCCGLKGTHFWLEQNSGRLVHFNLYGYKNEREVMLTMDHVIPKSNGGKTAQENIQLLCVYCNSIKGSKHLSITELKKTVHEWELKKSCPKPPKPTKEQRIVLKAKNALDKFGDKIPADRKVALEAIVRGQSIVQNQH